jgi:hypothetical protein
LPPVGFSYQLIVDPALDVALNESEIGPGVHDTAGVVLNICGEFTVTETGVEGDAEIGTPSQVMIHLKSVDAVKGDAV